MSISTISTASFEKPLTIEDIERAVERLRGLPPSKWMLVAPDGRMWAEEDITKLFVIANAYKYGVDINPSSLKGMSGKLYIDPSHWMPLHEATCKD